MDLTAEQSNSRTVKIVIIANKNIPQAALKQIGNYGNVLSFETNGITYPAISSHPDVFFCKVDDTLIIAPNIPSKFRNQLIKIDISFIEGTKKVGYSYPETATYNAVVTEKFLIHNLKITDSSIKELCGDKTAIHVNQAYTRCNLLPLKNDGFITSDLVIHNTLSDVGLNVLYVNPKDIILPGFDNGFFGGACGVNNNKIFVIGSLRKFNDANNVVAYLKEAKYEIIELYDGSLFDGGSLIFLD
ncbi:MAG: hypothetical protein H8E34_07735 [Bacteroidetes bacterium]|nr:hypothetical protein [Bacteroidota bacterium]MBL6943353.1 hypothetical protein [Bacteroidales bacterium]